MNVKRNVILVLGIFLASLSGLQIVHAEVLIPENEYAAYFDANGQYTVIGAVRNTEEFSVMPTITVNIDDDGKLISESIGHVAILPSTDMPFKIKFPEVSSKNPVLLKPTISYEPTDLAPMGVEVIYDQTLVKHLDGHLTGRIINNGNSTAYDVKVSAIIHGYEKILDVGQNVEIIDKIEPGEIKDFSMYPDPSIDSKINYYSCFALGDTSIVTLNGKRNDEQFTIRIDSGLTFSYPEFDSEEKNLSLKVLGGWPLADYANLEFPISSTSEKFDVYFNDEPIDSIQSIDEMATWHVAFNLPPHSQGDLLISGFEKKDDSITEQLNPTDFLNSVDLPSSVTIQVFNPPLKQLQIGIESDNVVCKEGLQLIQSIHGKPACVRNDTVEKLVARGWATVLN